MKINVKKKLLRQRGESSSKKGINIYEETNMVKKNVAKKMQNYFAKRRINN